MEEITWTFFVLNFEKSDNLNYFPLVFMVPENRITTVKSLAYDAHDMFHYDNVDGMCIGEFFTNFLDENEIPYMEVGIIPLRFNERYCGYLADDIHTVLI